MSQTAATTDARPRPRLVREEERSERPRDPETGRFISSKALQEEGGGDVPSAPAAGDGSLEDRSEGSKAEGAPIPALPPAPPPWTPSAGAPAPAPAPWMGAPQPAPGGAWSPGPGGHPQGAGFPPGAFPPGGPGSAPWGHPSGMAPAQLPGPPRQLQFRAPGPQPQGAPHPSAQRPGQALQGQRPGEVPMNQPQQRPQLFVTSPFGNRINPVTQQPQFHNGVDLGLPEGHPVRAPISGKGHRVTDDVNGNGLRIVGQAGGVEWSIGYAHLREPGKEGPIQAGEVIGYVGQTGRATGPHLHLTVRANGHPVDPLQVMDWRRFQLLLKQGDGWVPIN